MRFTASAEAAVAAADKISTEAGCPFTASEHLLIALLSDEDCIACRLLKERGVTLFSVKAMIPEIRQKSICGNSGKRRSIRLEHILEYACDLAVRHGGTEAGTEHLLLAVASENECTAAKLIAAHGVRLSVIFSDVYDVIGFNVRRKSAGEQSLRENKGYLRTYGSDLCDLFRRGRLDPCLCREKETEQIVRILCRRNKCNPCLTGEAGVGKTAVVEGLAALIASGEAPASLCGKTIVSVDVSSVLAGTRFRGDFEERFRGIISEAQERDDVILFFDEIHTIMGAGAAEGAIDAANMLKHPLSRGEITVIGATTRAEYERYIESDPALSRRFMRVDIPEPGAAVSFEMICGIRPVLQEHHGVIIRDGAVSEAIRLSEKYIKNRYLPDKAIDIIDEASAAYSSARRYGGEIKGDAVISEKEIDRVFAEKYRSPFTDAGRLRGLEPFLRSKIFGQDEQIRLFSSVLYRRASGMIRGSGPAASFLFTGPSGVGKKSLCAAAADYLYDDPRAFIRLDAGAYADSRSVVRAIYENAGVFPGPSSGRRIARLICFENADKAAPEVCEALRRIIGEGELSDAYGGRADFYDSVIVIISDAGVSRAAGFASAESRDASFQSKIQTLSYDRTVRFDPLDRDTVIRIIDARLSEIRAGCDIDLSFGDGVCGVIAEKCPAGCGAGEIMRTIERYIEEPLSVLLLEGAASAVVYASGKDIVTDAPKSLDKSLLIEYN